MAGNSNADILLVKSELMTHFRMKDLGAVKDILGIQVSRNRAKRILRLSQEAYTSKLLERFQMSEVNAMVTPIENLSSMSLSVESKPLSEDIHYRSIIGSLMYLMICTRTDFGFAASKLSKYFEKPLRCHWNAVKLIYRYAQGTQTMGIEYGPASTAVITAFSDYDWAGCIQTRK